MLRTEIRRPLAIALILIGQFAAGQASRAQDVGPALSAEQVTTLEGRVTGLLDKAQEWQAQADAIRAKLQETGDCGSTWQDCLNQEIQEATVLLKSIDPASKTQDDLDDARDLKKSIQLCMAILTAPEAFDGASGKAEQTAKDVQTVADQKTLPSFAPVDRFKRTGQAAIDFWSLLLSKQSLVVAVDGAIATAAISTLDDKAKAHYVAHPASDGSTLPGTLYGYGVLFAPFYAMSFIPSFFPTHMASDCPPGGCFSDNVRLFFDAAPAGFGNALLVDEALKFGVGRCRPDKSDCQSFPSDHSAFSWSLAGTCDETIGDWRVCAPLYAIAAYVSDSRVRALKHYPSDVVFGGVWGWFSGHIAGIAARHGHVGGVFSLFDETSTTKGGTEITHTLSGSATPDAKVVSLNVFWKKKTAE